MRSPGTPKLERLVISFVLLAGAGLQAAELQGQELSRNGGQKLSAFTESTSISFAPLPDSPGALQGAGFASTRPIPPCIAVVPSPGSVPDGSPASPPQATAPCSPPIDPYERFLDTTTPVPLSAGEKGYLALHNLIDPANLITVFGTSAYTIASSSHTHFGPGWRGFGRNSGTSLLQDATGEFFGTFLIPALTHEDPHYHRLPHAAIPRRVVHALSRTVVAQHDDGTLMPNYATMLVYPICAEISNLYVPGIHGNGPSTVARISIGLATDPADNLITEFLPDLARHIHIRVIFVQRILNGITRDPDGPSN